MDSLPSDHLLDLLARAEWYVRNFEPTSHSDAFDQGALLQEIENVLPRMEPVEGCKKGPYCCRMKDHEGDCDDLPF